MTWPKSFFSKIWLLNDLEFYEKILIEIRRLRQKKPFDDISYRFSWKNRPSLKNRRNLGFWHGWYREIRFFSNFRPQMIFKTERVCRINYVEYDWKNHLPISLTVLPGKIGQVWKIVEIQDFDMDDIGKIVFFENLSGLWFRFLRENTNWNT